MAADHLSIVYQGIVLIVCCNQILNVQAQNTTVPSPPSSSQEVIPASNFLLALLASLAINLEAEIKPYSLILNAVGAILSLAAIAVFVMLIIGGYKYLTSAGNPKAIESAEKTLTSAIIGIILVALSFLILRLIEEFTGAEVTNFMIRR
jgi:hypothetical protein